MQEKKYYRFFNPIFIYLVLIFLLVLFLIYRFSLPLLDSILWLVMPTKDKCHNLSASIGLFWGAWVSYFLAFFILLFYAVVFNSETKKEYIVGSGLGICFTSAWFFWGTILFLFCGIRAH